MQLLLKVENRKCLGARVKASRKNGVDGVDVINGVNGMDGENTDSGGWRG